MTPIPGIKLNADAIGQRIYRMICEAGQDQIVAFRMLPKPFMDIAEAGVREKLVALAAEQRGMTVAEAAPFIDQAKLEGIVSEIMREIGCAIYKAASHAGRMVV